VARVHRSVWQDTAQSEANCLGSISTTDAKSERSLHEYRRADSLGSEDAGLLAGTSGKLPDGINRSLLQTKYVNWINFAKNPFS
jgi:hypothetical protein